MRFQGWTDEALIFFEGLEVDNSKAYWQAHQRVYDEQVRAPMLALLAELAPEFGEPKLFRPYRDVRFSADKSPYKTAIAATLASGGYVQFSAAGLGAAAGAYHLAPDQLDRYRRAVAEDRTGTELERIAAALARAGSELVGHDVLKTAPRGYRKDHPRVELLRRKGLTAWREFPPADWLGTGRARAKVAAFLRSTWPLREWLAANVGDSELERR